jgi:hypothetical protein
MRLSQSLPRIGELFARETALVMVSDALQLDARVFLNLEFRFVSCPATRKPEQSS